MFTIINTHVAVVLEIKELTCLIEMKIAYYHPRMCTHVEIIVLGMTNFIIYHSPCKIKTSKAAVKFKFSNFLQTCNWLI